MPEETKPKFLMKSEFSMGQYDFERYNRLLMAMDEVSIRVSMYDATALLPMHSILWEMCKNFMPIMLDIKRNEFKNRFRELREKILAEVNRSKGAQEDSDEMTVAQEIIDEIDELQMNLLDIKQIIGLGIQIGRQYSPEELIAKGLRG